ncbi:MAG: toll/interleukin-1 receptor domain-containing protein [Pseudomonadota bacterium]
MRIFISHGLDKKAASDMQFLDRLQAALETPAAGGLAHQVLLDRSQLEAGDSWQDVLHEMLAECDAAVLLLSPRALTRPWVLKESTVLAYRKALDPRFPLYPVLLGGVAAADLGQGQFSPLCLQALQGLQPGAADPLQQPQTNAAAAKAVAKALQARLAQWLKDVGQAPATPMDALEAALKARIRRAGDLAALERLCERLTGRPLRWRPVAGAAAGAAAEPARLIAATLVSGLALQPGLAPPNPLASLIDDLVQQCGLDRDDAQVVLDLLVPLWTRPDAAACLADVAGRNRQPVAAGAAVPAGVSVALQCELADFSADRHVRRALLPTTRKTVVRTLAGGHSDNRLEELKAQVRDEYRRLGQRPGQSPVALSAERVDARLANIDNRLAFAETVFFVIPAPLPDAALLADLQACFPRQTFILHSAGPLPAALPPRVLALPVIDPDHELAMAEDQSAAYNLIADR